MAKIIFLTGAPQSTSLEWDEASLLQHFQAPVQRFLGVEEQQGLPSTLSTSSASTSFVIPKWRLVPCHASIDANASPPSSWPTAITQLVPEPGTDAHLEFLEHSLAMLNGEELSLISFSSTTSTTDAENTTLSFPSSTSSTSPSVHADPLTPILLPITALASLPSASTLLSLHPQTPTITLLAAVIHSPPSRTVQLRRHHPPTAKQIHELLLGDETRAAFSVTFWFPAEDDAQPPPAKRPRQGAATATAAARGKRGEELRLETERLRGQVAGLRPGDVVLMQNIALREWRGVVYGASLEGRMGRSRSKVKVFGESMGGREDGGDERSLPDSVQSKLMRVRRWRDEFVGRGHGGGMMEDGGEGIDGDRTVGEDLPVDETQVGQM